MPARMIQTIICLLLELHIWAVETSPLTPWEQEKLLKLALPPNSPDLNFGGGPHGRGPWPKMKVGEWRLHVPPGFFPEGGEVHNATFKTRSFCALAAPITAKTETRRRWVIAVARCLGASKPAVVGLLWACW